jgi:hypothetical protein
LDATNKRQSLRLSCDDFLVYFIKCFFEWFHF